MNEINHIQSSNCNDYTNNNGNKKSTLTEERPTIIQEVNKINDNCDPKEGHPKYDHEEMDPEETHDIENKNDDPKESNELESSHAEKNRKSSNQTSELQKESHPEQHVLSDEVDQQDLSNKNPTNSSSAKHQNRRTSTHERQNRRTSTHERCKNPADLLLIPGVTTAPSIDESLLEEDEDDFLTSESPRGLLQVLCLNPKFCLRTQLLLSFGSVSAIIISFIFIISVLIAWKSGENIKSINEENFENLVSKKQDSSVRILAESLTSTLIPESIVRILSDSVKDRFAGYPNESDEFVPFFDVDSQSNKYPVVGVTGKSLPLDWEIDANVNDDNHEEHVQGRWSSYADEPSLSTANGVFFMQGMCDPSVTDSSVFTYWENCTEANNDVLTGGVVTPSPTNKQIYNKASSITPILKALFEGNQDIYEVGMYFSNGGAGAVLNFPAYQLRTNVTYTSAGCEWMTKSNPYDSSRSIGTKEEIARCRPDGAVVSSRIYNVNERNWCRDQALNPSALLVEGPYISAFNGKLTMTAGQAVYDRVTNNFIGCSHVGMYLDNVEDVITKSKFTETSEVSVVKFEDGTVIGSTSWKASTATGTVKIYELNIGLTFESFEELTTLIDFTTTWDPTEVREKYETVTLRHDGFLVAAYPIPPVPDSYDPNYAPSFIALLSASEKDVFQIVDDVKTNFDEHVIQLMYGSFIVGAIGLALVLLIIYLMSKTLTAPLSYMNTAADQIINHYGSMNSSAMMTDIINSTPGFRCSPKTELDDVVKEFNKLVSSFDFASVAKNEKDRRKDVPNGFVFPKEFEDLYESRKNVKFGYKVRTRIGNGAADSAGFINFGSNISGDMDFKVNTRKSIEQAMGKNKGGSTSRLFFWTILLIGTPLLLTTIAIPSMVMYLMSKEFHSGINSAKSFYLNYELKALSIDTSLWADVVSSRTARASRDLYILTRYTSWLLFGAVEREKSFTQLKTSEEQCKTFEDTTDCPFYRENFFCDCAWNDHGYKGNNECTSYTFDTRSYQDLYFSCEASDTFANGDRNYTNYPNVSYSPESTVWWDNVRTVPGSEKGASASGYETTYDRLRVTSASPLLQLVYNQDVNKDYFIANYIAFEADGIYMGYDGCSNMLSKLSQWKSTKANGASKLRPELCPLGKYGYDPRCREWYDTGKKLAEKDGTPLYVTSPYVFVDQTIGQTATSPLIDPQTNTYVGQVMIDFNSLPILDYLIDYSNGLINEGFPILITNSSGADSVVGPGFSVETESARPISELVLPDDHKCNEAECKDKIDQFEQIVSSMKDGERGGTEFHRTSPSGSVEKVYIAYAPITLNGYRPINSSDFSRGVQSHETMVYSLALAETERSLLKPFEQIEEENNKRIRVSIAILSAVIFFSILVAIYIMNIVILSLIDPMLVLHDVIQAINRLDMNEEPPIINRSNGSKELISFSGTIQTLYKLARCCGNYDFLSGDLERAYEIMHDASRLFHRLDNKKAVGIVSGNLGTLLLVVFRAMDEADEEYFCGMTKAEVINKGISFYYEAIQLGEEAYDELQKAEGISPNCLGFMEHLSNRYFNRGTFLLTVRDGHTEPDEVEKLGYMDLDISLDLDMEIANSKHGMDDFKKYDLALGRAKGHLMLQEMGYPDTWDVEDRLDDTFVMVRRELQKKNDYSSLFELMNPVGRLQEIETELIRYKLLKGEVRLAAQIGIRMLVEDEYIFREARDQALKALSVYNDECMDHDRDTKARQRLSYIPSEDEDSVSSLREFDRSVVGRKAATQMLKMIGNSSRGYLSMEGF